MKIVEILSPYGKEGNKPNKIVWHSLGEFVCDHDGKVYYCTDYLKKLKISAHYFVSPSGTVIQTRKEHQIAYHARGHNVNSIGIEAMVPGVWTYPEFLQAIKKPYMTHVQKVALYELFQNLMRKYELSRNDVHRHSDLDATRKFDPGDGISWSQLAEAYRTENEKEVP